MARCCPHSDVCTTHFSTVSPLKWRWMRPRTCFLLPAILSCRSRSKSVSCCSVQVWYTDMRWEACVAQGRLWCLCWAPACRAVHTIKSVSRAEHSNAGTSARLPCLRGRCPLTSEAEQSLPFSGKVDRSTATGGVGVAIFYSVQWQGKRQCRFTVNSSAYSAGTPCQCCRHRKQAVYSVEGAVAEAWARDLLLPAPGFCGEACQ